jgi:DNA-binding SARP family transcriptional activator/tetratricopeptide (TPR) repeat protein
MLIKNIRTSERVALVEILILGTVELRVGEVRLALGSDKERALLAALALDVGRPVALDALIDRLWDGEAPPRARENVYTYLSRLRRRLRHADPDGPAPGIVGRAHTYALQVPPESVDWHRFQRLVAATAVGDDQRTMELLSRAEELWQGEALAGLPGAWAESVRRTLAERRLAATVSRIAAGLRLGCTVDLVGELSELVERHPADETLLGQLMLAYYGRGRYTDALRVHQQARQLLMVEYGARPGVELNRIHRGILDRVPVHDLVRGLAATSPSSSAALSAVAAAQLEPARVQPPTLTPAIAPTPSLTPPRNLPHQPPLVGRRAELRALCDWVEGSVVGGSVVSLETVSGMAGVGKTAVAVRAAEQLAGRYPDGQVYVDMRGHSPVQGPLSAGAALATLLRLLGAPAATIPVELEERAALWRGMLADRRVVVVLDDAVGAEQVRPLLAEGSPSLTIVTSRRHLNGLPFARSVALSVLSAADAVALFRRFAGEERTQDLVEAHRIVRLCGYLPLAIELVANRFRARPSWTLTTLSERLARDPGRLGEIRDAEHDLEHVFDVACRTLGDSQRRAFRRLGLHPGPDFTADAAAAMLGLPPQATERLLEGLLANHLLSEPTPDRYRYHDLLREYARQLALDEDGEQVCARVLCGLVDFYIDATEQADRLANPRRVRLDAREGSASGGASGGTPEQRDSAAARAWLAAERVNVLAVVDWALAAGESERSARLGFAIAGHLDEDCYWQDCVLVLQQAAAHWTSTGDQYPLCLALMGLCTAHARTGRYPEAAEAGERALEIARATGDRLVESEALRALGGLHWHLGEHRTALTRLRATLAIQGEFDDKWYEARGHSNIGITLIFLGEHQQAMEHLQQAVAGFTRADDRLSLGKALNNLADLYLRTGQLESARGALEEALRFLENDGNRYDLATARGGLADVLTELGDVPTALRLYHETSIEFQAIGDRQSQADTLIGLGQAHGKVGDVQQALRHYREALEVARLIGAGHQVARALRCLGEAEFALGQYDRASRHLREAVETASRTQELDEAVKARAALSAVRHAAEAADEG